MFFESSSEKRQAMATSRLVNNILNQEMLRPVDDYYSKQLPRSYGQLLFDTDMPMSKSLDDLFIENDFNPYDYMYDIPSKIMGSSYQPDFVDPNSDTANTEAMLQTSLGTTSVDMVSPAIATRNMFTLYRLFENEYDKLGLRSQNAGFFKAIGNSMSFKFDWRFFSWGIRNNAGDIPMKTKWAFDLLTDINYGYDAYKFSGKEGLLDPWMKNRDRSGTMSRDYLYSKIGL